MADRGSFDTHPRPTARSGPTGAWLRTGRLTKSLVRSLVRVTAATTGTAVGFALLVLGVGRPILQEVDRMAETGARGAGGGADRAGALKGALVVTARSWRDLTADVARFSLAVTVWVVPLSLLSIPVLLAAGVEPTARVTSRNWEVGLTTWGPALACAVTGALLLATVPAVLRGLTGDASSMQAVGR